MVNYFLNIHFIIIIYLKKYILKVLLNHTPENLELYLDHIKNMLYYRLLDEVELESHLIQDLIIILIMIIYIQYLIDSTKYNYMIKYGDIDNKNVLKIELKNGIKLELQLDKGVNKNNILIKK